MRSSFARPGGLFLLLALLLSWAPAAATPPDLGTYRAPAVEIQVARETLDDPLAPSAITVGGSHTCVLTPFGGVKCWGANAHGQLGDGTTTDRSAPVAVAGLATGVKAIAAGGVQTCALTTTGAVKCWGGNSSGALGDGTTTDRLAPTDVTGLETGVAALAAGYAHTCALLTTGGVKCWGQNDRGQLGDGTVVRKTAPVDVVGLAGEVSAIAAGGLHTCALMTTGGVKCWGSNDFGQLGVGTGSWGSIRTLPADVVGLTQSVSAVAAGWGHTCALTTTGGVKCWGANNYGQLGDGTSVDRVRPVDVVGLASGARGIAAGWHMTCAITTGDAARCWGRNDFGQLGTGATEGRKQPADVAGLSAVSAVAAGWGHTCALAAGGARCWGTNAHGELGLGTMGQTQTPVDVVGPAAAAGPIAAGGFYTCSLTATGTVQCWGQNWHGQLGDGTTTSAPGPVEVAGLAGGVDAITANGSHTCALTAAGGVECWGYNGSGQLGDGTSADRSLPAGVSGLAGGVSALASGWDHTCALTTGGDVMCWGSNLYGNLGDGTTTGSRVPVAVTGLASDAAAIAAGWSHTCAVTTAGGARCWGDNQYGQLGDGTTTKSTTPVAVAGLSDVSAMTAGYGFTCALTTAGGVKCWGNNASGQLGDGTTASSYVPVDVVGLASGVTAIASGSSHTCALTTTGAVKCWGGNDLSQLGDGTTTKKASPVDVVGLASGASAIAAGGGHSCALTATGGIRCWGDNQYGQLGDGSAFSTTPLAVPGLGVQRVYVPLAVRGH